MRSLMAATAVGSTQGGPCAAEDWAHLHREAGSLGIGREVFRAQALSRVDQRQVAPPDCEALKGDAERAGMAFGVADSLRLGCW